MWDPTINTIYVRYVTALYQQFLLLQVYFKRYLCDVGSHNKHDILYVGHVTALYQQLSLVSAHLRIVQYEPCIPISREKIHVVL
jgi:hypothetical protein